MKKIPGLILTLVLVSAAAVFVKAQEKAAPEKEKAAAQEKEKTITSDSRELFEQVQIFADSLSLITTDYVEPVKAKDLVYGAIQGMTDTLDGYSQFLDQESFREITEETKGEFGGVGIEIGVREGILTVISPIDDTPAYKAGIKAGDMVVKIEKETTRDMSLDDAVKKLRGKPGTKVSITVIREGIDKVLDFDIKRAVIKLKSIKEYKILEEDIGYVKLIEFQERTPQDLEKAVRELMKQGAHSLVLDIRNNPGGLLEAAVDVADSFLSKGDMIVYTEGRDPEKRLEFKSQKEPDFPDLDMVVLVNKGTASAGEILAGAIKDNKRGVIVGVPTFGKGSVQTVIPLKDETALRITTASYFTPSGKSLRDTGVDPDIYVKYYKTPKKSDKDKESKKKIEVFEGLEKDESKDKGPEKEKDKKDEKREMYDSHLRAAVNILKGLKIFEEYKTPAPAEEPR